MTTQKRIWTYLFFAGVCQVLFADPKPCNLKIFDNGEDITDRADLCIAEYTSPDCRPYAMSFNRSLLPDGYSQEADWIQGPRFMDIVVPYNEFEGRMYPGLSVLWKPPTTPTSKKALIGYLVKWIPRGKDPLCRLYTFNTSSELLSKQLDFKMDIKYLTAQQSYVVQVYSMPAPDRAHSQDYTTHKVMELKTGGSYSVSPYPADWAPSLSVKTSSDGTITAKFSLAPPHVNVTHFEVSLVKKSVDTQNAFEKRKVVAEFTTDEPEGIVKFTGLETDQYEVVVWVDELHLEDIDRCVCWKITGTNEKVCDGCGSVSSGWFNLTVTDPPLPPEPTTTPPPATTPTDTSTNNTPEIGRLTGRSGGDVDKEIIIVIVVAAVVFVVAIAALCIYLQCFKDAGKSFFQSCKSRLCRKYKATLSQQKPCDPSIKPSTPVPTLSHKQIFVMSADDHEAHTHLVECLIEFLQVHCWCSVISPHKSNIHQVGAFHWVLNNINKGDFILFVDSEGAEKLVEAYLNKQLYRARQLGPEGDAFSCSLRHIFTNTSSLERVIPVYFEKERCRPRLTCPISYKLPDHLPSFLRKIHNLDSKAKQTYSAVLPMDTSSLSRLPEGNLLLQAINSHESYQQSNPTWLAETFGEPTPVIQQTVSITPSLDDSGIFPSVGGGTLSVSTQDLSISDAGSPQSVFECGPDFRRYMHQDSAIGDSIRSQGQRTRPHLSQMPINITENADEFSAVTIDSEMIAREAQQVALPPSKHSWNKQKQQDPAELSVCTVNTDTTMLSNEAMWPKRNIVPPDAASKIEISDTISEAFREINNPSDFDQVTLGDGSISPNAPYSRNEFAQLISPPSVASEVQADRLSSAFQEINEGFDAGSGFLPPDCAKIESEIAPACEEHGYDTVSV